jgi:hypothetical protein
MQNNTTEFSFELKPSGYGIGVFAVHDIVKGSYLRLFAFDHCHDNGFIIRKKEDVPETFRKYCIDRGETLSGPKDFGCMDVGWHVNHSNNPNSFHSGYEYYALRNIEAGEEITIDYNSLDEPEEAKEDYYKQTN